MADGLLNSKMQELNPYLVIKGQLISERLFGILNYVQVNLCQKYLYTRQLTHNMTTDCSMISKFSTRKLQE